MHALIRVGIGIGAALGLLFLTPASHAQSGSILFINGVGAGSVPPVLTDIGFTVITDQYRPGAIADHLSIPNDINQVWIWNDGTYGNTGSAADPARNFSAADEAALRAFNATHRHWIMDDLAWRGNGTNLDQVNFTKNEALNLFNAGGGIVLGTDDASGDALIQHVNQVTGWFNFEPFTGTYFTLPNTHRFAGSFLNDPFTVTPSNVIGTTTYAEVPHGQQPNGLFLYTAVFGIGLDIGFPNTPMLGPDTFDGVTYASVNHIVTTTIPGAGFGSSSATEPETVFLLTLGLIGTGVARRR